MKKKQNQSLKRTKDFCKWLSDIIYRMKDFDKRCEEFYKELEPLLKKYNVLLSAEVKFPQYNILPDDVQLALKVLANHDANLLPNLVDKK